MNEWLHSQRVQLIVIIMACDIAMVDRPFVRCCASKCKRDGLFMQIVNHWHAIKISLHSTGDCMHDYLFRLRLNFQLYTYDD